MENEGLIFGLRELWALCRGRYAARRKQRIAVTPRNAPLRQGVVNGRNPMELEAACPTRMKARHRARRKQAR